MCNTNSPIKFIDTISIPLTTGINTYDFPTDAILDKAVKITKIIASYDQSGQKGPNGQTLIDAGTFKSGYLSFTDMMNNTKVQQIPLARFGMVDPTNGYPQQELELSIQNIVSTKCQLFLGDATSTLTTGMVLLLSVSYE